MLVEKSLVLLIPCTEILQKLVSQFHDLLHADILTLLQITQNQSQISSHFAYINGDLQMFHIVSHAYYILLLENANHSACDATFGYSVSTFS